MGASYWGCDIGGKSNTHWARIRFDTGAPAVVFGSPEGCVLELARTIWADSCPDVAPIFLVLDAILSHCLCSPEGWRPADKLLAQLGYGAYAQSQSHASGHRHLELAEQFGAYFIVAETNPRPCLGLMGAQADWVRDYKRKKASPDARLAAVAGLRDWLSQTWFGGQLPADMTEGHIDALACAMVAAAMGGHAWAGLELVTPVLANATARADCGCPVCGTPLPNPYLLGPGPYYMLVQAQHAASFR